MLPGLSSRATKDAGDRPGHCVHILCKDNANEMNVSLLTNSRVQLSLCKDNANERKESLLSVSRVQLILCKDNANQAQHKIK